MAFVLAKERTVVADTGLVLDTDQFLLASMFLAHLFL